MQNIVKRFVKDESGATAIEYGLIAAIVAVTIIAALQLLGGNLAATFNRVAQELVQGAGAGGGGGNGG